MTRVPSQGWRPYVRGKILESLQESFNERVCEDGVAVYLAVKGWEGCQMHTYGACG